MILCWFINSSILQVLVQMMVGVSEHFNVITTYKIVEEHKF